jgi:Tfp pilus assembly protein PilN
VDPVVLLNLLTDGGVLAVLILLIYLLVSRRLIVAKELEEVQADNKLLREQIAALVVAVHALTAQIIELDRDIEELRHQRGMTVSKHGQEPLA